MILKSHSKPVDKSSSFRPKINFIKIAPEKGPSRMGKLTNSYNLKKINPKIDAVTVIIKEIWKRLRETHRLRVVK